MRKRSQQLGFDIGASGGKAPWLRAGNKSLRKAVRENKQPNDVYERELIFQVRAYKLPKPYSYLDAEGVECYQFKFALAMERHFRADLAWPDYKLLVEVQGGIWRQDEAGRAAGAHSHPIDLERDIERMQYAALLGYTVLPVIPREVKSGHAIDLIQRVLVKRGWKPAQ